MANSKRLNRVISTKSTPLNLERLESRMLCTVNDIADGLQLLDALHGPSFSTSVPIVGAKARPSATTATSSASLSVVTSSNQRVSPNGSIATGGIEQQLKLAAIGQNGKPLTVQPTFNWAINAVPSGGSTSIRSTGGNVTLTFTKAGAYKFNITGAGQNFSFSVNVSQTLSALRVTPDKGSMTASTSQQFTAQAVDQFRIPMASQPAVVWSASAGGITKTGLFTAPGSAGSATIVAKVGSLSGSAVVTIVAKAGLQNAKLSSLVTQLNADGSLSRTDVMQILRTTGTDGVVDASELNDMRYLVTNASAFNMASYVQSLASNVVHGSAANMLIQGAVRGNLSVGSSAALLTTLVDKWFLGTDLPAVTGSGITYAMAAGPLFNGVPSRLDELQGVLGDCYFIATLGAIADRNPAAISNMFIDNADGTFTVRFYTGSYSSFYRADGTISDGFSGGVGVADYITVNKMLPSTANGAFVYSNYGKQLSSATTPLWLALAEKAYAQWNATGKAGRDGANRYASIEGGWMGVVNAQVLGKNATDYVLSSASKQSLVDALNTNKAVTIGTKGAPAAGGLVGSHAYSITAYNTATDTFTLYNPWGFAQPTPLTWSQLQTNCSMFVVGDATSTTPIFTGPLKAAPQVRALFADPSESFLAPAWGAEAIDAATNVTQESQIQNDERFSLDVRTPALQESDSLKWNSDALDNLFAFDEPLRSETIARTLTPEHIDRVFDDLESLLEIL